MSNFNTRWTTIPAEPGFFVLRAIFLPMDDEVQDIHRVPVIGWRMDDWGNVAPMTPFSEFNGDPSDAYICPDGIVRQSSYEDGYQTWRDVSTWIRTKRAVAKAVAQYNREIIDWMIGAEGGQGQDQEAEVPHD